MYGEATNDDMNEFYEELDDLDREREHLLDMRSELHNTIHDLDEQLQAAQSELADVEARIAEIDDYTPPDPARPIEGEGL